MNLTRTIKLEVQFPSLRPDDRLALYKRLWGLQNDLTRAANRVISALWLVRTGALPHPERVPRRGPKKGGESQKMAMLSLAYEALKADGEWRPFPTPCYEPYKDNPRAGGGVLAEHAAMINVRMTSDFDEIRRGEKSLATFRSLPIPYRAVEVELRGDGCIILQTFEGRSNNRVTVRPVKLDGSQNAILHRLRAGEAAWAEAEQAKVKRSDFVFPVGAYKLGSARLQWDQPQGGKGKWFLSLSWTDTNHETGSLPATGEPATEALVAGIDLGIQNAVWIAFTKADGTPVKRPETVPFPRRTFRAVARISKERRERSTFNRAPLGLREGKGRTRKMRVVEKIGDKVDRLNDTMIGQIAAAAAAIIKRRGAAVAVLEDHGNWSVEKMHDLARQASSRDEAAKMRASYFRWHQGAMRVALRHALEALGILVVDVDPAYTSRLCHACGIVHKRDWYKRHAKEGEVAAGRIALREFVCHPEGTEPTFVYAGGKLVPSEQKGCGYKGHADHNAGINIARRGIDQLADPTRWTSHPRGGSSAVAAK